MKSPIKTVFSVAVGVIAAILVTPLLVGGTISLLFAGTVWVARITSALYILIAAAISTTTFNLKKIFNKIKNWFITLYLGRKLKELKKYMAEHKGVVIGSTLIGALGVAAVAASAIHFRRRKKESKETPFAVRVMTTMQSLLGVSFMAMSFFDDSKLLKEMKEVVNNSILMTRIVSYFEDVRKDLGLTKVTKVPTEEFETIDGKKFRKNSVYVKPLYDKTRDTDQWIWVKYVNDTEELNDMNCMAWMTSNREIFSMASQSLYEWAVECIEDAQPKKPSMISEIKARLWPPAPAKRDVRIVNKAVDEELKPVVEALKESLCGADKEALFSPLIQRTKGKTVLNMLILSLPALCLGVVKFAWISRNFSPTRIGAITLACFVTLLLTILDPIRDAVDEVDHYIVTSTGNHGKLVVNEGTEGQSFAEFFKPYEATLKEAANRPFDWMFPDEYLKEGVNRWGGKRWRAPGGGVRTRRFKKMRLSDAEYKALQEVAARNGMPVGALVRAKVDAILGYDEQDDTYAYDSYKDARDDNFRHSKYDEYDGDDFYSKVNRDYDDEDDIVLQSANKPESVVDPRIEGLMKENAELKATCGSLEKKLDIVTTAITKVTDHLTKAEQATYDKEASTVGLVQTLSARVDNMTAYIEKLDKNRVTQEDASKIWEAIHETQSLRDLKGVMDDLAALRSHVVEVVSVTKEKQSTPVPQEQLDAVYAKLLETNQRLDDLAKESKKSAQKAPVTDTPPAVDKKELKDEPKPESTTTVNKQKEKPLKHFCGVCRKGFASLNKVRKHAKLHEKKERLNKKYPAYDSLALRKSYLEIQVLKGGKWVHQGGAVATTEGGGRHCYSVNHNIEGWGEDCRARLPDLIDPTKDRFEPFPIKVVKFDSQNKWDGLIFEIPSNISNDVLHRMKVTQVASEGWWLKGVSLRTHNNKLTWFDWDGELVWYNIEQGLLEMSISTQEGDSGSPVLCWNANTLQYDLIAVHMQAGSKNAGTNTARLVHELDKHLFRPQS